ncbi:Methylthioribose-1-phosphate isomerase-like, N-terminal domain [Phytophthora cactorum]|nr:Methylthioribose-1-phosphate isomerase-like, N-terminal domain [Phytophthora cactorum]
MTISEASLKSNRCSIYVAHLKLVEVKGPRDRLSDKQLLWLEVLSEEIGLDTSVMHVEEPEKHAKRKIKERATTAKSAPTKRQNKRRKRRTVNRFRFHARWQRAQQLIQLSVRQRQLHRQTTMAGERMRSVLWTDGGLQLIDQRKLPTELVLMRCETVDDVTCAIADMAVRGAPAIGAAGAFGLAIAAKNFQATASSTKEDLLKTVEQAKTTIDAARPTAVNLTWATERVVKELHGVSVADLAAYTLTVAQALAEEDVAINKRLSEFGAEIVPAGANILHHCNTGALATVDIGTAIGVIYECHAQGKNVHVWVDETRPRLQGARLSAWELMREGVPIHLIADNAAGYLMLSGKVDVVLFGADRVAANGDVVNKIGTYKLAVVAKENKVPVYACVPTSTIDLNFLEGMGIPIEERSADEVACIRGVRIAPEGCPVFNPAFDVTPNRYLTGIITEEGVCYPPFEQSLAKAVAAAEKRRAQA